jgi:hypothetical protein
MILNSGFQKSALDSSFTFTQSDQGNALAHFPYLAGWEMFSPANPEVSYSTAISRQSEFAPSQRIVLLLYLLFF